MKDIIRYFFKGLPIVIMGILKAISIITCVILGLSLLLFVICLSIKYMVFATIIVSIIVCCVLAWACVKLGEEKTSEEEFNNKYGIKNKK